MCTKIIITILLRFGISVDLPSGTIRYIYWKKYGICYGLTVGGQLGFTATQWENCMKLQLYKNLLEQLFTTTT